MIFSDSVQTILRDFVSIVAVLGGGSVVRAAQVSGLTWQHVFPRLMPAPQALFKDVRAERLSTERGTVIGVYSGNLRPELNFFTTLMHPKKLKKYEVELVRVSKKGPRDSTTEKNVYGAEKFGPLLALSLSGLVLSAVALWLSLHYHDQFALVASILLSLSSTIVGLASWWKLDLKERAPREDREDKIPEGDVVIYYARLGAFRVVRCEERMAELYFRIESCDYILGETAYRAAWLCATVLLMSGFICLRRSKPEFQIAFATSYVFLNILYWLCSALDPTKWHWSHDYQVVTLKWKPSGLEGPSFGTVMDAAMPAATLPNDVGDQAEAQITLQRRHSSFPTFLTRRTRTGHDISTPES